MRLGRASFSGGVHPAESKSLSAATAIEVVSTPKLVAIPLLQHLGAPCIPTVKSKEVVELGQTVGSSDAPVSAPVHASISGVVVKPSVATLPNGRHVATIPIKATEEQPLTNQALYDDMFGGSWPTDGLDEFSPGSIAEAIHNAGLVGMGGAAFPTWVKLSRNPDRPVDTLLVNGSECEPYLTADDRVMIEASAPIVSGALLAARCAGADRIIIAIEDNKPLALTAMREATEGTGVEVVAVKTKYPQGAEKQLAWSVLARTVPGGGLPLDVRVVVINVGTAAAVARAVIRGRPLTHRVITVSGQGITTPKNLLVPIGISYRDLIEFAGGLRPEAVRVIVGGPMMGFTLGELGTPITKGTSGITVLDRDDLSRAQATACIRCGHCVDVCPMGLVPTRIALASRHRVWDLARRYHITACVECGSCAYQCPAKIPLVQLIRMSKATLAA
jgi:electron transport complex protein RnfC